MATAEPSPSPSVVSLSSAPSAVSLEHSLVRSIRMDMFPYSGDDEGLSAARIAIWGELTSIFIEEQLPLIDPSMFAGVDVSSNVRGMEVLTAPVSTSSLTEKRLSIRFDAMLQYREINATVEADLLVDQALNAAEGRYEYIQSLKSAINDLRFMEDYVVSIFPSPPPSSSPSRQNNTAGDGDDDNEKALLAIMIGSAVGVVALVLLIGMCFVKRRRSAVQAKQHTQTNGRESDLYSAGAAPITPTNHRNRNRDTCAASATTSRAVMSMTDSDNTSRAVMSTEGSDLGDVTMHSVASATTVPVQNTRRSGQRSMPPTICEI